MEIQSINPHDQTIVGSVKISTPIDIENAVLTARKAFDSWRKTDVRSRCALVGNLVSKLEENRDKLANLMTLEMGKTLQQSLGEIDSEIEFVKYYSANGVEFLSDENVFKNSTDISKVTYEPYGVCVCICPWNFPLSMVTSGVLPAIIAGNAVIVKPSEYTSLSQKLVVDLINQCGFPEGVVNIVIGGADAGEKLVDSDVDLVWFTGSTKAGLNIYKKCGEKFVKALLEMGGSSAGIVLEDANLENAVENLYWARFLNCGQVCTAVKRLFVHESIYDKFMSLFVKKINGIKIGNPLSDNDLGPLINKKQLETITSQVQDALSLGAKVVLGGKVPTNSELVGGNYFEPTILTDISKTMRVYHEETFGPVLPIIKFTSDSEVIELANDTEYGLSAEIYSSNLERAEKMAREIKSGTVAINTDNFFRPECPFGGYKKSGTGREYGKIGMQEFAQVKVISISDV